MDLISWILSRKYTDNSILGISGVLAGKNATIESSTKTDGTTTLVFKWTADNGTVRRTNVLVDDGVSVESVSIGTGNHLLLTFSDGTVHDAGKLPIADNASEVSYTNAKKPSVTNVKQGLDSAFNQNAQDISYTNTDDPTLTDVKLALDKALSEGAKLKESLTVSNPVGSATNGKTYAVNTDIEKVIRDMLIKEEAPTLTLNISPSKTLYDVVNETVSGVVASAVVAKKTYNLSKVEFYVDNVLKNTQNISADGTYTYNVSFSPATNSDFVVKAIVYDSRTGTPMTTTKSITVKFVGKSYYGTVGDSVGEPTDVIIKALQNNTLKDVKKLVYSHITMDYGKVVYAYPASFGALTKISDEKNNINYTNSFTRTTVTVDGISYYCYTQTESSASSDVELTFV